MLSDASRHFARLSELRMMPHVPPALVPNAAAVSSLLTLLLLVLCHAAPVHRWVAPPAASGAVRLHTPSLRVDDAWRWAVLVRGWGCAASPAKGVPLPPSVACCSPAASGAVRLHTPSLRVDDAWRWAVLVRGWGGLIVRGAIASVQCTT